MSARAGHFAWRPLVRGARLVVGCVLAWAALAKLGDIPGLAREIHNFRIVPVTGENLVAIVLPWIELAAAAALVLGLRARAGALVATGLLAVFTAATVFAIARGLDVECGCFGTTMAMRTGGAKLLVNLGLLALAVAGIPSARHGGADPGEGQPEAASRSATPT